MRWLPSHFLREFTNGNRRWRSILSAIWSVCSGLNRCGRNFPGWRWRAMAIAVLAFLTAFVRAPRRRPKPLRWWGRLPPRTLRSARDDELQLSDVAPDWLR